MNLRRRRLRQLNRQRSAQLDTRSHEQLVKAGRELGFAPFCGSWPIETLRKKVKELENGSS